MATVPTIKVQTTLVMVPTVVTDKAGKRISDLTEEDFEILRDGQVQKIGLFRHVQSKAEVMKPGTPPADGVTNTLDGNNDRLTIFVVDFLNSTFTEQHEARKQILKFLSRSLDVKEPICLLALDGAGVKVIHDFTTDPAVLAEALKQVTEKPTALDRPQKDPLEDTYRGVWGRGRNSTVRNDVIEQNRLYALEVQTSFQTSVLKQRIKITLEALRQIGEAFTGIPGRKSMVWATGGFPFEIDDASRFDLREHDLLPSYQRTWRALNKANIAVYPLDVEDLVNPAYVGAGIGRPMVGRFRVNTQLRNMENFADVTGGKFCDRREDAESCFHEAADDSSDYYLIGIYENSGDAKPGWKKLSAKVRRPGALVRARQGYYVGPAQEEKQQAKEELAVALISPIDYTALPLAVRWSPIKTQGANGKKKVEFMYALGPGIATLDETNSNHMSMEFVALAKGPKGEASEMFSKSVEGHITQVMADDIKKNGVKFPGTIELPPGEYTLTFAARDNLARQIGSVSAEIKVP